MDQDRLGHSLEGLDVMQHLVWESNAGFSMRELTKTQRWFFTWKGLSVCKHKQSLRIDPEITSNG